MHGSNTMRKPVTDTRGTVTLPCGNHMKHNKQESSDMVIRELKEEFTPKPKDYSTEQFDVEGKERAGL